MATLTLILSMLVNMFSAPVETVNVYINCHQIGDNQYTCDGGTR